MTDRDTGEAHWYKGIASVDFYVNEDTLEQFIEYLGIENSTLVINGMNLLQVEQTGIESLTSQVEESRDIV